MAEERQVHATLDFTLGPGVEKASKDMVAGMAKISKAYLDIQTAASKAAKEVAGPRVVGALTGSAADALARAKGQGPEGFLGRTGRGLNDSAAAIDGIMGRVGGVAGGVALAAGAASVASNYGALSSDRYYTESQRVRKTLGDIPGIGHAMRVGENIAGRPGALLDVNVAADRTAADIQTFGRQAQTVFGEVIPQAGREALAGAARGASPVFGDRVNRTTASGEQFFREQSRLLPVMREQAKIQRELSGATREKQVAEQKYQQAVALEADAIKRRNQAAAAVDKNNPNDIARLRETRGLSNAETELQQASEIKRQARETLRTKQVAEGEAKSRGLLNTAAAAETRAGNLEERAATAAGSAQRLGGQNPYDRAFGVQALKALQQYGPDGLPPEMLAAAQQFAPQTAAKILEQHGAGTAEFAEGRKIAPADFAGSPEELRQKAEDARRDAERARLEAERTITQVAADSGKDLGAFLANVIKTQGDSIKREIENQLRIQRSGQ